MANCSQIKCLSKSLCKDVVNSNRIITYETITINDANYILSHDNVYSMISNLIDRKEENILLYVVNALSQRYDDFWSKRDVLPLVTGIREIIEKNKDRLEYYRSISSILDILD